MYNSTIYLFKLSTFLHFKYVKFSSIPSIYKKQTILNYHSIPSVTRTHRNCTVVVELYKMLISTSCKLGDHSNKTHKYTIANSGFPAFQNKTGMYMCVCMYAMTYSLNKTLTFIFHKFTVDCLLNNKHQKR